MLDTLMSPANNYSSYRTHVKALEDKPPGPVLPYVGASLLLLLIITEASRAYDTPPPPSSCAIDSGYVRVLPALFLRDITFVGDANPTTLANEEINTDKMDLLGAQIQQFQVRGAESAWIGGLYDKPSLARSLTHSPY